MDYKKKFEDLGSKISKAQAQYLIELKKALAEVGKKKLYECTFLTLFDDDGQPFNYECTEIRIEENTIQVLAKDVLDSNCEREWLDLALFCDESNYTIADYIIWD